MMDKNTAAVLAAAVIIAFFAATAAFFLLQSSDSGDDGYHVTHSERLMIFGNADGNDVLDSRDVAKIEELVGTSGWKQTNPFADANNDGVISSADVDMAKRMVKREAMDIFYAYMDGSDYVVDKVSYPIKNYVMVGDDVSIALQSISATSKCKGVTVSDFDDPINSWVGSLERIGNKSTAAEVPLATKVADKDTVLITSAASRYVTNQDAFELAGIDVVRMNLGTGTNGDVAANYGLLTIGYLLGLEKESQKAVKFSDDIIDSVRTKVKDLDDSKKAKAIVANRTANISGKSSEYYYIAQLAGAKNMIDENSSFTSFNVSKGDDWLYGVDVDHILHFTSLGYGDANKNEVFSTYDANFKLTDAYKAGNYDLMNANMPTAVSVAFSAESMYPDLFEKGYGYKMLNEYIKNFTCLPSTYDAETAGALFFMSS